MDNLLLESINAVFSYYNLLAIFAATVIGIAFGATPGLGAIVGMSVLMPFSFHWPPVTALIFMATFTSPIPKQSRTPGWIAPT